MGYASCYEDNLDARGEPKSSKIRKPADNLDVKTESVKRQVLPEEKVEKQKAPICVLQLEVERILKRLAKQERLSNLTIASWAEYVRGHYEKYGGLPAKVDIVSLVAKALISLNHKRFARAISRGNSSCRWKIFETKYELI